jgi:hypothetical protein
MPNSITVDGIGVRLISFSERAREYRGEVAASFLNTLQDGRDAPRRTWEGVTDAITPAEEATLRTAVEAGDVVCDGLVLYEESVLCSVTVENATRGPDVQSGPTDYSAVNVALNLTFREVG